MNKRITRVSVWTIAGAMCLCGALSGCGSSNRVEVTGQVLRDGAPIQLEERHRLAVTFYLAPESARIPQDQIAAEVDDDGSFVVRGARKRGIIRGTYRVGVEILNRSRSDQLKGVFDFEKTPFHYEIVGGEELVLDIGK